MTLLELKDYFKDISLRHKSIKTFQYGSDYDLAVNKDDTYPQFFLELPFLCDYELGDATFLNDNLQIAFNIFVNIADDDIDADMFAISLAKEIGDQILLYINETCDDFKIESAASLSLREYTDDSVAGCRYDLVILFPPVCVDDWNDVFKTD